MALRLTEVAARVPFPLVAFPPGWWNGPVFVGDVRAVREGVRAVQLYYLTPSGDGGFVISQLAPAEAERTDPLRLTEHLASFVSHLDPAFLAQKARRTKGIAFTLRDFVHRDEILPLCGHPTAVRILSHRLLTLRAARTAIVVNGKATDLCVGAWQRSLDEALTVLTPVTPDLARRFDLDAVAHGG